MDTTNNKYIYNGGPYANWTIGKGAVANKNWLASSRWCLTIRLSRSRTSKMRPPFGFQIFV